MIYAHTHRHCDTHTPYTHAHTHAHKHPDYVCTASCGYKYYTLEQPVTQNLSLSCSDIGLRVYARVASSLSLSFWHSPYLDELINQLFISKIRISISITVGPPCMYADDLSLVLAHKLTSKDFLTWSKATIGDMRISHRLNSSKSIIIICG